MKTPRISPFKKAIKYIFVIAFPVFLFPISTFAADPPYVPDGRSDGYKYMSGIPIHYYKAILAAQYRALSKKQYKVPIPHPSSRR